MLTRSRILSLRKYSLILIACLSVVALSFSNGLQQASAATSPSACAVTPTLLGGQGFSVSGQGFSVSGQGFSVSGQGFSVSGQGFSVSGQGLDPLVVAAEIRDNPVTPGKWVNDRLDFFMKRLGFNTDSTAIIIVDEFTALPGSTEEPHGEIVKKVVDDSIAALKATVPTLKIDSFAVDISDVNTNYNADAIASKIAEKVSGLQGTYHHFVLNMSFGLISCTDPGPVVNGTQLPAFNFNQAQQVVAANNKPTPTLGITPIVECVIKVSDGDHHHSGDKSRVNNGPNHDDDSGAYIAYFGYKNDNDQLITVPVGSNNQFSPFPSYRLQPYQFEPGQQHFVFAVAFNGSNLTWSIKGPDGHTNTVTASKTSTPCSTVPPIPTQQVKPMVECIVAEDNSMFEAHFGYINPNAIGVIIPVSFANKFSPSPADRGQVTTFVPGEHHDVFDVYFDGSNISWTLNGITVTANSSTELCPEPEGFGVSDYLTQNLGVPQDQIGAYYGQLADNVSTDEFQSLRQLLQKYLSDSADPSKHFTAVTVASSGNLRPWLGDAPLAPASWDETIAVGATLDDGPNIWSFSEDANVLAPGVGYPLGNNSFAAGTSFASPAFSVLVGMCSTVPNALKFDGKNPPLALDASGAKVYNNAFISTSDLSPLLCKPNSAPTINPISDRNDKEGDSISFQVSANDVDGGTLTYSATNLPAGITISSSGLISGTLATGSAGTYNVTVTVKDNGTPQASASTSFSWVVTSAVNTVKIDIRPYSSKNRINLSSYGLVAVAIFGSPTFDATAVDPSTVTLAGAPAVKLFGRFYTLTFDINHDGKADRILWFQIRKLQLTSSSTEAVLLGKTAYGLAFRGVDKVTIVAPHAPHLVSPGTGSGSGTAIVKLTWGDDEDWEQGDNVCYNVQVSKSAGFSSITQGATVVDQESVTTSPLSNGTYYWRVAFSDCANTVTSTWSDVWTFKVQR